MVSRMPSEGMSERLGWAVVGCGWVAQDYVVPAIVASRNGRLVVACDACENALATMAGDGFDRTTDLLQAIDRRDVHAVYVATPNSAHCAVVKAAAAAGKHVLCEKPIATNCQDAGEMTAACERSGVTFAAAFDQRFHPAHQTLARLVKNGRLGAVTQARIHYACWLPPDWSTGSTNGGSQDNWRIDPQRAGGGALIDLAPHGVDLLEAVLHDEWTELFAMTQQRVHAYPVDDGAVLMGRFHSGTLAVIQVGYNCPERYPRRILELIGTKARALAVNTMGQTAGGMLMLTDADSGESTSVPFADQSPFVVQVEAFADAVLSGEPFAYPPHADLRKFELLDGAWH